MRSPHPKDVAVKKYGRYWAVHIRSKLLVVTVYKKGAFAVKKFIERRAGHVAPSRKN
jgi:hypothetical protein